MTKLLPPPRKFELTLVKSALLAFGLTALPALSAPTGGEVVAGVANITTQPNITNINQSSQNAVINWQSFNVAPSETVNFHQPNREAVTLNRVIGNERSVIDGAMNANGKVFIQNANGTLIGKNAQINVGSLVATTANISDDDFMSGRHAFVGEGTGSIENLGQISVPKGGVVALVAPIVKNAGTITAPEGNTLLASAESFSITLPDNADFKYTLDKGTLQGLVDNGGAILADGGRVVLTAQGVDTVKKSLIKHTGAIQANTVSNNNGVIELLGDLDNSALNVSGSLKAEAKESGDGGFIETSAAQVKIENSAEVSTLAENGKTGTWLIDPNDIIIANGTGVKPDGTPYTKDEVTANGLTIANQLTKSNVAIQSTKGKSEGKGDVIIDDEIVGGNPHTNPVHTLKLDAYNDIHINKNIDLKGAVKLALEYGQGSANGGESDYHIKRGAKVNLPMGNTLTTKKGKDGEKIEFTVIHQMPDIIKNKDGDWESQFNIRNIAFGKDIDLSYTKDYEGFVGWQLPNYTTNQLLNQMGNVHGLGHTISNLHLNSKDDKDPDNPDINFTGLFQMNDEAGEFRDMAVIDANVKSNGSFAHAGALVGFGYNIRNSFSSGTVQTLGEYSKAGGLVGAGGNISNSHASNNVTSHEIFADAGGLIGYLYPSKIIKNSYATGKVMSLGNGSPAGGLVGTSSGINKIANSYATGNVEAYGIAGGLVGSGGDIINSYATGDVLVHNISHAGGLVGLGRNISNSYANNKVSYSGNPADYKDSGAYLGGIVGYYYNNMDTPSYNSFFNKSKNQNLNAIGYKHYYTEDPSTKNWHKMTNVIGKTEAELKKKSTFTKAGWDFDNVWYINAGEMPKLHAHKKGTITINPNTPNLTDLNIQANNLSKVYDGVAIDNEKQLRELAKKNGHSDIVTITGLKDGDTLAKLGTLRYDSEGNTWKNAKNAGEYKIVPSGLTGGQDYEIKYGEGTLKINKRPLIIQAMNNFKPLYEKNSDSKNIGILAMGIKDNPDSGLAQGETISNVQIKFSKTDEQAKSAKLHEVYTVTPTNIKFGKGDIKNYDVKYGDGKILVVPQKVYLYDFPNMYGTDSDGNKYHKLTILNDVYDEMLLSDAVYGAGNVFGDKSKGVKPIQIGSNARFFEVYEVNDKNAISGKRYELKPYDKNASGKYMELLTKSLLNTDTDPKDINIIDISAKDEKDKDGAGLAAAVYKKTKTNEYFVVFRGTDDGDAISPFNADGRNNLSQVYKPQYDKAYEWSKNMVTLIKAKDKNAKITFVGHSLGGGLASYSAASIGNMDGVFINAAQLGEFYTNKATFNNIHNISDGKNNQHKIQLGNMTAISLNLDPVSRIDFKLGDFYKTTDINFLSEGAPIKDHVMPHAHFTRNTLSLVDENHKYLSNNSQILQDNRYFLNSEINKQVEQQGLQKGLDQTKSDLIKNPKICSLYTDSCPNYYNRIILENQLNQIAYDLHNHEVTRENEIKDAIYHTAITSDKIQLATPNQNGKHGKFKLFNPRATNKVSLDENTMIRNPMAFVVTLTFSDGSKLELQPNATILIKYKNGKAIAGTVEVLVGRAIAVVDGHRIWLSPSYKQPTLTATH